MRKTIEKGKDSQYWLREIGKNNHMIIGTDDRNLSIERLWIALPSRDDSKSPTQMHRPAPPRISDFKIRIIQPTIFPINPAP